MDSLEISVNNDTRPIMKTGIETPRINFLCDFSASDIFYQLHYLIKLKIFERQTNLMQNLILKHLRLWMRKETE